MRDNPHWLNARFGGPCQGKDCTEVIRKGDRIFYYPNGRKTLVGACADAVARDFASANFDEGFLMQTRKSRYRRKSITVSDICPTGAIHHRLGRVHVGTPDAEVAEMIREAVTARRAGGDSDWTAEAEEEAVRFALWCHAENLAEYRAVMC